MREGDGWRLVWCFRRARRGKSFGAFFLSLWSLFLLSSHADIGREVSVGRDIEFGEPECCFGAERPDSDVVSFFGAAIGNRCDPSISQSLSQ